MILVKFTELSMIPDSIPGHALFSVNEESHMKLSSKSVPKKPAMLLNAVFLAKKITPKAVFVLFNLPIKVITSALASCAE